MDKKWVGTGWKMNKGLVEAEGYAETLAKAAVLNDPKLQAFVFPPFTVARQVKSKLSHAPVLVGAQNMHWEVSGAWTGEISAPMLTDCGLDLVELGHSERRAHFGETDETVGLKTEAAVRHNLIPLVCVGETRAERDAGATQDVLATQVAAALAKLDETQKSRPLLFAYEPVWAIGDAGEAATPDYADQQQAEIKSLARKITGVDVPCLCGGSVSIDNCAAFIVKPNIDGLFIGRAAWTVEGYISILERCAFSLQNERKNT